MKYEGEISVRSMSGFVKDNPDIASIELTADKLLAYKAIHPHHPSLPAPKYLFFAGIPVVERCEHDWLWVKTIEETVIRTSNPAPMKTGRSVTIKGSKYSCSKCDETKDFF